MEFKEKKGFLEEMLDKLLKVSRITFIPGIVFLGVGIVDNEVARVIGIIGLLFCAVSMLPLIPFFLLLAIWTAKIIFGIDRE